MSAASMATSAPVPIAMPTSAAASAGASLMPSPTIATMRPSACSRATAAALSAGRTSARTRSAGMPTCARDRPRPSAAVAGHEPDIEALACSSATASAALRLERVGRRGDSRADGPSAATQAGVSPARRPGRRRPGARRRRRRARAAGERSRRGPVRPVDRGLDADARRSPRSRRRAGTRARLARARARIAAPSGCSLPFSTAPARSSSSSGADAGCGDDPADRGRPTVSVPVLSSTTVSTRWAVSSASPPRMRMPASAPRPVPTMIAVGVARPIAHGQAMTTTAMNAVSARVRRGSGPSDEPDDERRGGEDQDERDEHLGDPVGEALDRRLRALGTLDELDDPGQRRVAPDPRRAHHERAGRVERRADDLVARPRPRPGSARRSASMRRPPTRPRPRPRRPGSFRPAGRAAGRRRATVLERDLSVRRRHGRAARSPGSGRPADGSRRSSGPWPAPRASGRAARGR